MSRPTFRSEIRLCRRHRRLIVAEAKVEEAPKRTRPVPGLMKILSLKRQRCSTSHNPALAATSGAEKPDSYSGPDLLFWTCQDCL